MIRYRPYELSSWRSKATLDEGEELDHLNSGLTLEIWVVQATLDRWSYKPDGCMIASVGHHALGRRYERGFGIDDASIKSDIGEIVSHGDELITSDRFRAGMPLQVPCRDGSWHGYLYTLSGTRRSFLRMRTFFEPTELGDQADAGADVAATTGAKATNADMIDDLDLRERCRTI